MPYNPTYKAFIFESGKTASIYTNETDMELVHSGDLIERNHESFVIRITRPKPNGGYKSCYQVYLIKEYKELNTPYREMVIAYLLVEFDVKQPREKTKGRRTKLR